MGKLSMIGRITFLLITLLLSSVTYAGDLYQAKTALKLHQHSKALKLFTLEARKNNIEAQYHLAVLYSAGKGTKKDLKKAFYWFKKSADKGHVRSQYNCGIIFENGYGVKANNKKAHRWYRMAARKNHKKSILKLKQLANKKPDKKINIFHAIKKNNLKYFKSKKRYCGKLTNQHDNGDTPLFYALRTGRDKITHSLLKCNLNTRAVDNTGNTALFLAVSFKKPDLIKLLIRKNKSLVNIANNEDITPLMKSVLLNDVISSKILLKSGASLKPKDDKGNTAYQYAVLKQNKPVIALLLSHGARDERQNLKRKALDNVKQKSGEWPLLITAAWRGQVDSVILILKKKTKINITDNKGNTAIIRASERGHHEVVKILIQNKAALNKKNTSGATALMLAAKNNHTEIITALINSGAQINQRDKKGLSALLYATQYGQIKSFKTLVNLKANTKVKDKKKRDIIKVALDNKQSDIINFFITNKINRLSQRKLNNLLLFAAKNGDTRLLNTLLKNNAGINSIEKNGNTALILSASNGHYKVTKLLLNNKATVNQKNKHGYTALMLSAKKGHKKIVNLLLKRKADTRIRNKDRHTALELAKINGHNQVSKEIALAEKNNSFLGIF